MACSLARRPAHDPTQSGGSVEKEGRWPSAQVDHCGIALTHGALGGPKELSAVVCLTPRSLRGPSSVLRGGSEMQSRSVVLHQAADGRATLWAAREIMPQRDCIWLGLPLGLRSTTRGRRSMRVTDGRRANVCVLACDSLGYTTPPFQKSGPSVHVRVVAHY